MDLDIVLRDIATKTWWVLDAKYGAPSGEHIAQSVRQLRVAAHHRLVPPGWEARGLVVHPPDGAEVSAATTDPRVTRTTLDRLPRALGLA